MNDEKYIALKNEIELLIELNNKLHIDMDMETFINEVLLIIKNKINFEGANIGILSENGEYLYSVKLDKKLYDDLERYERVKVFFTYQYPLNENVLIARPVITREELYYPDINYYFNDENTPEFGKNVINKLGYSAIYILPLLLGDKCLGSILFYNTRKTLHLEKWEKEYIQRLSGLISRSIENNKAYNIIKEQNKQLEYKNKIIHDDLRLAERIQKNLLPKHKPKIDKIKISMYYRPYNEVGGDYFDFYLPEKEGKNKLGVLITDASGHGVAAAFITSMIKMVFESSIMKTIYKEPEEVLSTINREIYDKLINNFVTAIYCYFDFNSNVAKLACAGHTPLYIINKQKEIREIHPKGRVLGLKETISFTVEEFRLNKGDRLFFYTDGLSEAYDKNYKEFEKEMFRILKSKSETPEDLITDLIHNLHKNNFTVFDDIALIVIDVK